MLMRELRHAARVLLHAAGFTFVAAATLALGIGATAAMFTVVNGILLAPLPYPDSDRIVAIGTRSANGRVSTRVTGGDYADLEAGARAFEATAYFYGGEVGVQLGSHAAFAPVAWTTPELFRVFSVAPARGRVFGARETDGAVVGAAFAARELGGIDGALGQHLSVEHRAYTVVGVVADTFRFPRRTEVWLPSDQDLAAANRTAFNFQAVARVRADAAIERAQAEADTIAARLRRDQPQSNAGRTFPLTPLRDQLVGAVRPTLVLLFGAVLLVLLIACANTANLLLARAVTRAREVAIRVSLGASRWTLVRQLLAESVLLSLLGGAGGVGLAFGGTALLRRLAPADLPRVDGVQVDWTVLGFTAVIALATSILFGVVPAIQGWFVDPQDALRQGGARSGGGPRLHRVRNGLVVAEIGLAFVLVVAASLLVRSLVALHAVDPGFRTDPALVMYAHVPAASTDEYLAATRTIDDLVREVRAVPGVTAAAAVMGLPGGQYGSNGSYAVEGTHRWGAGDPLPAADFSLAGPGYFATMGIPLVRGRAFDARDAHDAPRVAIISESLARETFPGEDPIGKRIICGLDRPAPMTIVGVVRDVRQHPPASPPGPTLYMPLAQHPFYANEVQVVLRAAVAPESLVEPVRRIVQRHDANVATTFTTLARMLDDSVATPRFRTGLFLAFGALALLLAMAGVYAVMSYVAAQRAAEFGVRLALGAQPGDVVRLMLGRAGRLATGGLAAGIALALAGMRLVTSLLFGVAPLDVTAFVLAAGVLVAITLAAALVPAWLSSRVDPVEALRAQ